MNSMKQLWHRLREWRSSESKASLRAEINRLQTMMMDEVDQSPLQAIDIKNGAIDVSVRPPHWLIRAMAGSFLETMGTAPNWSSMEIGPVPTSGGMLIATVRWRHGETPEETVEKFQRLLEEIVTQFDAHEEDRLEQTISRAKMLLAEPRRKVDESPD
jgi:hypothetical protein